MPSLVSRALLAARPSRNAPLVLPARLHARPPAIGALRARWLASAAAKPPKKPAIPKAGLAKQAGKQAGKQSTKRAAAATGGKIEERAGASASPILDLAHKFHVDAAKGVEHLQVNVETARKMLERLRDEFRMTLNPKIFEFIVKALAQGLEPQLERWLAFLAEAYRGGEAESMTQRRLVLSFTCLERVDQLVAGVRLFPLECWMAAIVSESFCSAAANGNAPVILKGLEWLGQPMVKWPKILISDSFCNMMVTLDGNPEASNRAISQLRLRQDEVPAVLGCNSFCSAVSAGKVDEVIEGLRTLRVPRRSYKRLLSRNAFVSALTHGQAVALGKAISRLKVLDKRRRVGLFASNGFCSLVGDGLLDNVLKELGDKRIPSAEWPRLLSCGSFCTLTKKGRLAAALALLDRFQIPQETAVQVLCYDGFCSAVSSGNEERLVEGLDYFGLVDAKVRGRILACDSFCSAAVQEKLPKIMQGLEHLGVRGEEWAKVLACGSLCSALDDGKASRVEEAFSLFKVPESERVRLLSCGGFVSAAANKNAPLLLKTFQDLGIPQPEWYRILKNNSFCAAARKGQAQVLRRALEKCTPDRSKWPGLLASDSFYTARKNADQKEDDGTEDNEEGGEDDL